MNFIFNPLWSLFKKKDEPSVLEKIDIAFSDAEIEGEKRGIAKASRVYEPILKKLKQDYAKLEAFASEKKEQQEKKIRECIDWLKSLEQDMDALKRELKKKIEQTAEKFNISGQSISDTFASGGTAFDIPTLTGVGLLLDLIYEHKMREIAEYEEKFYKETVEKTWKPKIEKLREKFQMLQDKFAEEQKKYTALSETVIFEIVEKMRQIAELKIILEKE